MKQQPVSGNTRSSAVIQSAENGVRGLRRRARKNGREVVGESKVRMGRYRRQICEITNRNAVIDLAFDRG